MIYKHLEQFFKDTYILSVLCITQKHSKSCKTYNRWTSPSHRGDHFCVGITFAVVQPLTTQKPAKSYFSLNDFYACLTFCLTYASTPPPPPRYTPHVLCPCAYLKFETLGRQHLVRLFELDKMASHGQRVPTPFGAVAL